MKRGQFVVLEGIDASGTTTQTAAVADSLRLRGHEVITSREPTAERIGGQIRKWLGTKADAPPPDSLALLFAADRLDHLARVVEPGLERGAIVLCDRYKLSSFAYQSLDCPLDWIREINARSRQPDLTLWLDVPVQEALRRSAARLAAGEAAAERFDAEDLQLRLHASYAAFAADPVLGVTRIDAVGSADEVTGRLVQACVEAGL